MGGPSITTAMRMFVEDAAGQIHTSQPGRVHSYDAAAQVADVEPLVNPPGRTQPIINCVPVIWPRGGDGYLVLPLERGDTGLLITLELSATPWRLSGEVSETDELDYHALSYSVFLPGLCAADDTLQVASGATILAGSDVRLGAADATEPVIGGNALADAISTYLTAVGVFLDVLPGAIGAGVLDPATVTVLKTAGTNLNSAITAAKTSVKVK